MTTSIEITGLRLYGYHGVLPQEKRIGNEYLIDITIFFPFENAFQSDSVNDTINYAEIVDIIKLINNQPSQLIENLAWRIKESLTKKFPQITSGEISVSKILPPIANLQLKKVSAKIKW